MSKKQNFNIVHFMLKHHLTYEQAAFWIEIVEKQNTPVTLENLEYTMLSLMHDAEEHRATIQNEFD